MTSSKANSPSNHLCTRSNLTRFKPSALILRGVRVPREVEPPRACARPRGVYPSLQGSDRRHEVSANRYSNSLAVHLGLLPSTERIPSRTTRTS